MTNTEITIEPGTREGNHLVEGLEETHEDSNAS